MRSVTLPKLTFWRAVLLVVLVAGGYSIVYRLVYGLGAATNLSDHFPWGLWIGFDVLAGVGLAAGGFTIAAVVHIFHMKKYMPIARPSILTAFLGYLLVAVAIMLDIGRPWRIWHPIVMHNPHSVMFEVAWCVLLYTTVLALEFSPLVWERLGWKRVERVMHSLMVPIVILGVILSTLHQSSLGSLYLIVPEKLYPLWYSPLLPVFFFVSAIAAGLAMVIFESGLSSRAFGHRFSMSILTGVARALVVMLAVLAVMRADDLIRRGALPYLFLPREETYLFWAETALGILLPMVLLAIPRVRENPHGLFLGATLAVLGFVLNRLNVAITGMKAYAGVNYYPSWMEISVTLALVGVGFTLFALAAKYLHVFPEEAEAPLAHAPLAHGPVEARAT